MRAMLAVSFIFSQFCQFFCRWCLVLLLEAAKVSKKQPTDQPGQTIYLVFKNEKKRKNFAQFFVYFCFEL